MKGFNFIRNYFYCFSKNRLSQKNKNLLSNAHHHLFIQIERIKLKSLLNNNNNDCKLKFH